MDRLCNISLPELTCRSTVNPTKVAASQEFRGGLTLKPPVATPPVWCTESVTDVACHNHLKPLVGLVIHGLVHIRNRDELIYITRHNNILHQTIISPRIGHVTWSTGVTLQKFEVTRRSRTIIRTLRHALYLQPVLSSYYIIVYGLLAWSEDLNKTTYATVSVCLWYVTISVSVCLWYVTIS